MTNDDQRPEPYTAAQLLWSDRYPSASILFCGGSVVRGEGFPSSDLDVVVVFANVSNAWRESFHFQGWPVEVFGHDPGTLAYFVAQDCAGGRPALAQMISEALVIPNETPYSRAIQAWAGSCSTVFARMRQPHLALLRQRFHGPAGRSPRQLPAEVTETLPNIATARERDAGGNERAETATPSSSR